MCVMTCMGFVLYMCLNVVAYCCACVCFMMLVFCINFVLFVYVVVYVRTCGLCAVVGFVCMYVRLFC